MIWKDLISAGLIQNSTLGMTMSGTGLLMRRTTDLGRKLMEFIARPDFLSDLD